MNTTQSSGKSICALAGGAVLAATVALSGTPVHADETKPGQISVSATGDAQIAPDMAVVMLGVLREAETAREALDANNQAMTRVLSAMEELGIEGRDLQTTDFSIQPRYERYRETGGSRDPKIVGYSVSNALTVRVRDLGALGDVIDTSVTLGVNQGGQISFTNDDPETALEDARISAIKSAIRKAEVLSEAAGVGLGRIVEISEQSNRPQPFPIARARLAMDNAEAMPIAAGENSYSVTVNVTFEIDQ